jgi:hypothetical protein
MCNTLVILFCAFKKMRTVTSVRLRYGTRIGGRQGMHTEFRQWKLLEEDHLKDQEADEI